MVCHGGFSLDDSVRRAWYNPEAILQDIGLSSGKIFVDVGCGDGFFSLIAARMVGPSGKVYSIDTDANAIERLRRKAAEKGLQNIETTVGMAEETIFCGHCADVVFYSIVLHDFNDPSKVLLNAKQMLKPTGTLADLDWMKKQMPFGPPVHVKFSEEYASGLIKQAGFKVQEIKDVGQYHYLILAES